MKRDKVLEFLSSHRQELENRFGVCSLALFGSVARDEAGPESDIDVLIEFRETPGNDVAPGMTPCPRRPWRIDPWQLAAKQSPIRFRRSIRCPRPGLAWRFSTDPSPAAR